MAYRTHTHKHTHSYRLNHKITIDSTPTYCLYEGNIWAKWGEDGELAEGEIKRRRGYYERGSGKRSTAHLWETNNGA